MYIVMTASAKTGSKYGTYKKVAIVELEEGFEGEPKMISERAKGLKRIVKESGACFVGKTRNSEFARTLDEYSIECIKMNSR